MEYYWKMALVLVWVFLGMINLSPSHKITKLDYGCVWGTLIAVLVAYYFCV